MKKRIISLLLALCALMLCACSQGELTDDGVYYEKTETEYVYVAPRGLYAVSADEELFSVKSAVDELFFRKVRFEDPDKFLCVEDSGELLLLREKSVEEPTLSTFEPIAAQIYNETNTVYITPLYADNEYLPEGEYNPSQDSALCRMIADTLRDGEAREVKNDAILTDDMFFIRLLSQKYPGLYYVVVFYGATDGRYYLVDRAVNKTVLCPNAVIERMVGQ